MAETDTLTYHVKPLRPDANVTTAQSLITKERAQKLDLLIHLLSNLDQTLVVCGPNGIGKTTVLVALQERKIESWQYCSLPGHVNLSFEAISDAINHSIRNAPVTLSAVDQSRLILLIDNAGELVPGLITAIIQYATTNGMLRVVFAMTHDELQVKRGTDGLIDNCHIIEIPTLSEKHCGDFLRYLSTNPASQLAFAAIDDHLIAQVYRETHGVPGRIISELANLSDIQSTTKKRRWIIYAGLALIIVGAATLVAGKWRTQPRQDIATVSGQSETSDTTHSIALPQSVPATPEPTLAAPTSEEKPHTAEPAPVSAEKTVETTALPLPPLPDSASSELEPAANNPVESPVPPNPQRTTTEIVNPSTLPTPEQTQKLVKAPSSPEQPSLPAKPNAILPSINKQAREQMTIVEKMALKSQTPATIAPTILPKPEDAPVQTNATNMAERLWARQEKMKLDELQQTTENQTPTTAPTPVAPTAIVNSENSTSGAYTLQLMVLSKSSSVTTLLKKYPALSANIKVVNTFINGEPKFVLEYGSYPNAVAANKARPNLPAEFRAALARKHR